MAKNTNVRHAEQKQRKFDRDVMSYEDMPLEDYEFEETEISPDAIKRILIGVVVALCCGLIVFAFANRDKLSPENISNWWNYDVIGKSDLGYPVNIVGSEVNDNNILLSENHIAYVSDTSFITLSSKGSKIAEFQHKFSTPVLVNSKNMFLTYNLNGTGFQIDKLDKQIYVGEVDENIFTADITQNGIYAIVTEGNGYLSTLNVYNEDNNRIYKYYFSDYYISSISLNSSGNGCIACGFSTKNGEVVSVIYSLNFSKEEPEHIYEITGDVVIDSEFLTDNKAVIIGKNASYIVKKDSKNYKTNSYNSMILVNYTFNKDTSNYAVALSNSNDGKNCTVNIYNANGDLNSEVETKCATNSISLYKDKFAVLDGNVVNVFSANGKNIFTKDVGTGSKSAIMSSDNSVYILSANQIRFFNLNNSATSDTAKK